MAKRLHYGKGSLYQKSKKNPRTGKREYYGSFFIKYMVEPGKYTMKNLNTTDRNTAEILYSEWITQRTRGDDAIVDGDKTVKDFMLSWLARREEEQRTRHNIKEGTVRRYRNIVTPFLGYLDERRLSTVSMRNFKSKHLSDYLTYRVNQTRFFGKSDVKITESGVNKEFKIIRSIFVKAFKKRIIPLDITEEVVPFRLEVKQKRLPTLDEMREVMGLILEPQVRDFFKVALLTGARSAEITHLKWENIDFAKMAMSISPEPEGGWTAKNQGSYRTFGMPGEVAKIFGSYREERPTESASGYIFKMSDDRPFNEYPNYAYRRITKAVAKANRERRENGKDEIPYFTPHTLRHWFICWALTRPENPLTVIELTKIVGHFDEEMIRKTYFHGDLQWDTARKMRETGLFGE